MWNLFMASALAEGEAAAAAEPTWLQKVFEKFGEVSYVGWIILAVLILLGVGLTAISRQKTKWTANLLAYAALSIALAFVLSYIRLWRMPQGGTITPASMLPMMLFSYAFGIGPGLVASLAYGLLQAIQDPYIVGFWQFLLDYPIAFGVIGLMGLFAKKNNKWMLFVGIGVVSLLRMICHTLSGVIFFGEYAAQAGLGLWPYSIGYHSFVLIDAAICIVVALVAAPRVLKLLKVK
jgi:thiamine transporter